MKIAIAGYGVEGQVSYNYWNDGANELTILDEREQGESLPEGANAELGKRAFDDLSSYDLVIRSPSIAPKRLKTARKVWSATNEFFAHCTAPIIGVTGTKGKGTTSSLIASILRAAGRNVHLVGNIGVSALQELPKIQPDDIVVFELSSFQLWDIERSPHVAVVLGIEPDHLDVHEDMEDYVNAKARIVLHQTADDMVIYNQNNEIATKIGAQSAAQRVPYPFAIDEFAQSLRIPGAHNVENASAAIAAVREYVNDTEIIKRGLHAFEGLPHRIKFVREINGVKFYDDSYSSAPSAAIAALRSFSQPTIILLGGYEKGADFTQLGEILANLQSLKGAIIYGQTRDRIAAQLRESKVPDEKVYVCESHDFEAIIKQSYELCEDGDIVVLSPASASFDMFKNFAQRGDRFIEIVNQL